MKVPKKVARVNRPIPVLGRGRATEREARETEEASYRQRVKGGFRVVRKPLSE